jgi:hypothetical protein
VRNNPFIGWSPCRVLRWLMVETAMGLGSSLFL